MNKRKPLKISLFIVLAIVLSSCNYFSNKNRIKVVEKTKNEALKTGRIFNLKSLIRPNEKLVLDSIYTDTIKFKRWTQVAGTQYLKGYAAYEGVLIMHLLDKEEQKKYQLIDGDDIIIQWKIIKDYSDLETRYQTKLLKLIKREEIEIKFANTEDEIIFRIKNDTVNFKLNKKEVVQSIFEGLNNSSTLSSFEKYFDYYKRWYSKEELINDKRKRIKFFLNKTDRSPESIAKFISKGNLEFIYSLFKNNDYYKNSGTQNLVEGLLLAYQEFEENPENIEKLKYYLPTIGYHYIDTDGMKNIITPKMKALLTADNYAVYDKLPLEARLFYVYSFWVRRSNEGNSAYVYQLLKDIHNHLAKDSFFSFSLEKAQGILLGDTINILDDKLNTIETIKRNSGELVSIETKSSKLFNTAEYCDAYYLVKLKFKEKEGLVDGRKVYKIIEKNAEKIISNNSEILIYRTEFYGVGFADDDGLTGCSAYHEPVIIKDKKNNYFGLIQVVQDSLSKKWADSKFDYFELANNDGFSDNIQRTTETDKGIVLTIERQYQEGYGVYQVLLRYQKGLYTVQYYNFPNKQYKVEDMVLLAYEETEGDDYYAIPYFYFADYHYGDNESYLYPNELKAYKVKTNKGELRVYKGYSDYISIISIQDKNNEVLYYKIIRKDTRYKVEYGDLDVLLEARNIAYKDLISSSNYVRTIDDWLEQATLLQERSTMYTDLELKYTPNIKAIQQEVTASLVNKYANRSYPLDVLLETYKQKTQKKNPIIMHNMLSYKGNKKYFHSVGIQVAIKGKRVAIPIDSINICYINNKNELFKVNYLNNSVDYTFGGDKDYILLEDNYLKVINSEYLLSEEGIKIRLFHKDMKKEDYLIMYQLKLKNTATYIYSPVKKIFYDKNLN